jgi:chemotaxis protein MotD
VNASSVNHTLQGAATVPVAGLALEIAAQSRAGKNRFEIRLDPPELGRIDVRLDMDKDGNVTSRMIVERSETLDLLRRDAQQLERALNQAGLKTADNALEFQLRDQGFAQNGGDNSRNNNRDASQIVIPDDQSPVLDAARGYGRLLGLGNGLDISV